MILVRKVTNGTYNVIATNNGEFILQGNLTELELRDLQDEINHALDSHSKSEKV